MYMHLENGKILETKTNKTERRNRQICAVLSEQDAENQ